MVIDGCVLFSIPFCRFDEADSRARAARQREDAARRDLDTEMEEYAKETTSLRNKVDALQEALSAAETSKAERAERDHAAMCEAKEELARSHVAATELQARLSEAIQRGNRLQISLESIDGDAARTWREKEAEFKRVQVGLRTRIGD
jgi:chromosome segregation ATPase